jgi:uncharacterized membrane protein YeaQ/YmgE (transglycosylase-associated protein family)
LGSARCEDGVLPVFFSIPKEVNNMSFLAWIVLGLLAGFIGSKIVYNLGVGVILDILLGIVGAVLGGWLFKYFRRFGSYGRESVQPVGRSDRLGCLPGGLPRCYASRLTRPAQF